VVAASRGRPTACEHRSAVPKRTRAARPWPAV